MATQATADNTIDIAARDAEPDAIPRPKGPMRVLGPLGRGLRLGVRFLVKGVGGGRWVAFILLLTLLLLRWFDNPALELMRVKTFDIFQRIEPRVVVNRPVTVVDIDDPSLSEIGQWPWPRTVIADIVTRLTELGAVVIGFDVVFPEPDRLSPVMLAEKFPELDEGTRELLRALPTNDDILADAIRNSRVVLGMSATNKDTGQNFEAIPPPPVAMAGRVETVRKYLIDHPHVIRNLPVLEQAALGRGLFNPAAELDGIVRRVPMVKIVDGEPFPSLTLEMMRVALGNLSAVVRAGTEYGVDRIAIQTPQRQSFNVRTDSRGQVWVYFAHYDRDNYVSARDVLNGTVDPDLIRGKLILIGTSAVGLLDIKSSPIDSFLPGVDVHAQILENIFDQNQLQRPREATVYELIATFVAGVLMIVLVPMVGARLTAAIFIVIAASMAGLSWWQFAEVKLLYDPVYPILAALILYMFLTYSNYAREEAERRQVRDAFSRYMSPALVERLASDPSQLKLGGEKRDMTMLFCDVRGFTSISELFDAEGLTRLINRFLTPMTDRILARSGTIDKYMGDCIMAFWNAPLDDDAHAANGCRAALEMKAELAKVNEDLEREAKEEGRKHIPLNIGIGLNSGVVSVGNMGSDQRFDYSVLGDEVNLASRLEGQSKTYGVTIVIGENTYAKIGDSFAAFELDKIRVKGKTRPVTVYSVIGDEAMAQTEAFKAFKARNDEMLNAYRSQDWGGAEAALADMRSIVKDLDADGLEGYFELYDERIAEYRAVSPGEDWDGVFVATTK